MSEGLLSRNLVVWSGLFALAFLNGAVREIGIKRLLDEPWAHHLSALTALVIFTTYIFLIWRKTGISTFTDAAWVGTIWFLLTVLTETFVLNRWISKLSWDQVIQSYNVTQGQLWPLVLVWIGILPVLTLKIKGASN